MGDLYFMPSDVARIVLGYLKESSYSKTYNCFLKECSYLKEIYNLEKAGRSLRKVTQLNLCKILEEWGHQKYSSENSTVGGNNFVETPSSDDTVDETLICDNDVTNSGRKTKARSRSNGKKSPQVLKSRRSPCTPKSSRLRFKSPRNSTTSNAQVITEKQNYDSRTPDKAVFEDLKPGSCNEITPKKSPLHTSKSAGKADTPSPLRKVENAKTNDSEHVTGAQEQNVTKKKCVRSTARTEESTRPCGLEDKTIQKDVEQSENITNIGENSNEENVDKNNLKDQSAKENEEAEPKHRKTKETSKQNINTAEDDEANSATVKDMSETTFVKTVLEPTSNSDANERCIAWLKKNDESVMDEKHCNANENFGRSGLENKNPITSLSVHENSAKLNDVKTTAQLPTNTDEASYGGTTSKSSVSTDTLRSNTPEITPGAGTIEHGSNQQPVSQLPLHVTPKKTSPESRDKSINTPMKLLQSSDQHTVRSPRRKKPKTPRKRTSEVSPVSVVSVKSVDPGSVNPIFEKILADHRLHEKLAETCNLVHSQIKLANSGKENKSDTRPGDQISPVPNNHSYDHETVTASQSLEEILGLDHNFHSEMLSDNIDMSDPAYSSLFKLFGTDRETFNEYLRKEKEKELALMEAEVEELERSNHEILCANFGVSNADAGYETQELAYSSPHHVALGSQDLFSTQHGSPQTHATSTPCGNGVPVSFKPILREGGIANSPVHSSSVFGGLKNTGINDKISPSSTATQPFSPAYSNYSEVNNPPTPHNQQHLSTYVNGTSPRGPNSPGSHAGDPYSNPATPLQSNISHVMHSTPTGPGNPDHFHLSSPIRSQHSAVKNSHVPVHCSPLVKADVHPHSPLLTHSNEYHLNSNSGLYFNSQITNEVSNKNVNSNNGTGHFGHSTEGYLHLLQQDVNSPSSREPCTTIENTIGCISLPPPSNSETKQNNQPNGASRSRRKREPVKRKNVSGSFATVKGLLEKPLTHLNTFPLSMKFAGLQSTCRTPEKRQSDSITLRSPGGKTVINVPLLNCEDQIDLSVLGMDENVDTADGSKTISVYNESLDKSTHYSIAPENQVTHQLMSAIEAGKTSEVLQQIQKRNSNETKSKASKRSVSERKTRARKKKEEIAKDEETDRFSPTPPSSGQSGGVHDGSADLNPEIYTATPFPNLHKGATVRALNFGPNVDDPDIAHYRKIYPKFQTEDKSPSVLILHANQVINPGHRVYVNSTPITLVQNMPKTHNDKVDINVTDIKDDCSNKKPDDREKGDKELCVKEKETSGLRHSSVNDGQNKDDHEKCETSKDIKSRENTPKKVQMKSPRQSNNVSNETPKKMKHIDQQTKEVAEQSMESTNEDKSIEKINDKKEIASKTKIKCSSDTHVQLKESNKKKAEIEEVKCKKVDNSSKHPKSKDSKGKEKLKVKIPASRYKSPKGKKSDSKSGKSGIPFYFKKMNDAKPESDTDSSDDDVPLSVIRNRENLKGKKKGQNIEKKEGNEHVQLVIESESTDEDSGTGVVISAPSKSMKICDENETNSKEVLFEKIGLTPTKSLSKYDLKSPNRANALDVMAEWQRSPLSSRRRMLTPNTRNRFSKADDALKSPTTPKRKEHAKQLFKSPVKEGKSVQNVTDGKGKHTAKRVDKIIDRLKQNNPDKSLNSVKANSSKRTTRSDKRKTRSNSAESNKLNEQSNNKSNNKKSKEKTSVKKETENLLNIQENEEVISENIDVDNLTDGKFIDEEVHNNSVIESMNEEGLTKNDSLILDENSQGASELQKAVASIEFDHSDVQQREEQNVPDYQYYELDTVDFNQDNNDEEPMDRSGNTKIGCIEISNTCDIVDIQGKGTCSPEKQNSNQSQGLSDQKPEIEHEQLVLVEVHRAAENQDSNESMEELEKYRHSVELLNEKSGSDLSNTCTSKVSVDHSDIVTQILDKPESSNEQSKVENINSEQGERKSKSKKKKRKHRHHHSGNEMTNIGEQFVSPGDQGEGERHKHHKKKKKKSKKRHREDGEDGHESKRRKKEKTNVPLDSLAALNVEEALTQIYGKQPSS
ncbi:uncharacterized protein LOC132719229 [Ruditapes philippinarum]|uniref:uncharacterized protein LOC132719229 n=1 Tax=Ruditapes philippinarum TaxID=129788 RepID=UPI00295BA3D1|nr:uncharacterized protein LOC132719229 [Ruditapes philippinarum]